MKDYEQLKSSIEKILHSSTKIEQKDNIPSSDSDFTYENGIKAWVSSLFIDIVKSSELFEGPNEDTARIMRSFCSGIISILKENNHYREIGIRGDCVYAIYSTSYKDDLLDVFYQACKINTFMIMLNKLLKRNGFTTIQAGIGLGCSENLIIKAGQKGTGINDKIWIGKAVVDASHLSDVANRNLIDSIAISPLFFSNISEDLFKDRNDLRPLIKKHTNFYGHIDFYHCSLINKDFENWIEENL